MRTLVKKLKARQSALRQAATIVNGRIADEVNRELAHVTTLLKVLGAN